MASSAASGREIRSDGGRDELRHHAVSPSCPNVLRRLQVVGASSGASRFNPVFYLIDGFRHASPVRSAAHRSFFHHGINVVLAAWCYLMLKSGYKLKPIWPQSPKKKIVEGRRRRSALPGRGHGGADGCQARDAIDEISENDPYPPNVLERSASDGAVAIPAGASPKFDGKLIFRRRATDS
ncbi:MAG: hypothetical protein R3C54_05080 [Parvularculaceae bacterium]